MIYGSPQFTISLTMEQLKETFKRCKQEERAAFVTYVTAGFPTADETVDILLGMQAGGAGKIPYLQQ